MKTWEATVSIDNGFPIPEVIVFDVQAISCYAAAAMAETCIDGSGKDIKKIKDIQVVEVPPGEKSRSGKMKDFIKHPSRYMVK